MAVVVQRDVLGQREVEDQPAARAGPRGCARCPASSVISLGVAWSNCFPPTAIVPGRGVAEAGDRVDQLGLAVVVDAGDPDDLAGAHLERDAAHLLDPAVVEHVQVLDLEQRLAGLRHGLLDPEDHLAADHQLGEAGLGRALARHRVDLLAAAQDADPVGDLEHLVQLVGDEDDRHPAGLEAAEDLEQLERLLRRQHRGRLVEDQDVGLAVERLQDLDPLLLADGQVGDQRVGVDLELEARRELADPVRGRGLVEQDPGARRLVREHDVLGDGHHRDQHEVLVHHPDPAVDRVLRRLERDRLAVQQDLALVGLVEPVEDVHQRRLAGAVLAEQRVHLAAPQVEIDVVVRDDPRKPLRDPAELQDGGPLPCRAILCRSPNGGSDEGAGPRPAPRRNYPSSSSGSASTPSAA